MIFETIYKLKAQGKKIGFTSSAFDLLTPGHAYMMEVAKSKCDYLVVGLLTDPTIDRPDAKNKPVQSILERFLQVQAVGVVDFVIPFETEEDLGTIIKMIDPDIRVVGDEYKGTQHTGWDLCPIHYVKRNNPYSSTSIRTRVATSENKK